MEAIFRLTKEDAEEVAHKLHNLMDTDDLLEEYGLTEPQAGRAMMNLPMNGGDWQVADGFVSVVRMEMKDHVKVLRDIANDARNGGEEGQSLRINKQAKRLETIFTERP